MTGSRSKRLLAHAAACLTVVLLALPASAEARPAHRGVQLHSLWRDSTDADIDRELGLAADLGSTTVRLDFSWASLEAAGKGRYSPGAVAKIDRLVAGADARGMKVVPVFWGTPCWASTAPDALKQRCEGDWQGRGVHTYAPRNPADYADAAVWLANRYGPKLAAIEIWTEPNEWFQDFLKAPDPARAYVDIIKAAYPRLKAAQPSLPVLGGGLSFSDGEFTKRLYDLGIKGYFDAFAIHPWAENRPPSATATGEARKWSFASGIPWIREIMVERGDVKPIWLTEFGWPSCEDATSIWCVSERDQAANLSEALRMLHDPSFAYVQGAIVYNLRSKVADPADREGSYGLVRRDYTLKPAYFALKRALTPPETSIIAGPTGLTATSSAGFQFGSSEPGSTFECRVDGAWWESCASPRSYSGISQGPHTFEVRAIDEHGNVDATPAAGSWIVRVEPPSFGQPTRWSEPAGAAGAGARIGVPARGRPRGRRGTVSVRVWCPPTEPRDCAGVVSLESARAGSTGRRGRLLLARRRFHVPRGQARVVSLRLSARARQLLRRARRLPVLATVVSRRPGGSFVAGRVRFTLEDRRPGRR